MLFKKDILDLLEFLSMLKPYGRKVIVTTSSVTARVQCWQGGHAEQVIMNHVLLHWTIELFSPTQRWKG